ncbi:MAG: tRNA dihydrouridine synthase DusB [Thermodesulfobacteriota bacterium]
MLRLGTFETINWLVLAPMSGRTNLPFRLLAKEMGAGLVSTEMISAAGLCKGQDKTYRYLATQEEEKPVSAQLFGNDPDAMAASAKIVVEKGMDIVDINMGCPAKKVVKTGAGAALMRDPRKAARIVRAVRESVQVPLTVKIRAGWSPQHPNALEVARVSEDCGADGISIHPRFASQGFCGAADWPLIARVKASVKIPVIGNGDVSSPKMALQMRSETHCDGVMIGRAALSNPWIFRQILELERRGTVTIPTSEEKVRLIKKHYELLIGYLGEKRATYIMRGLLLLYTKGLPNRRFLRASVSEINGRETFFDAMRTYFGFLEVKELA